MRCWSKLCRVGLLKFSHFWQCWERTTTQKWHLALLYLSFSSRPWASWNVEGFVVFVSPPHPFPWQKRRVCCWGFLLENCHVTIPCRCQAWNSDISRVPSVCSPWYLRRNWDRGIAVLAWRLGLAGSLNCFVRAMGYTSWHFLFGRDRNPGPPKFPVGEWVPILVGRWGRKWSCFLGCNTLR